MVAMVTQQVSFWELTLGEVEDLGRPWGNNIHIASFTSKTIKFIILHTKTPTYQQLLYPNQV